MLWYKAWRESRIRFLLSAALITCMCFTFTLLQGRLYPGIAHEHAAVHNYTQYIHWTVYGGVTRGILQLSCLVLALGGLQRDKREGTLGFTLALPVSRVRLVLTRAATGLAEVLVLSLLPPFFITGASHLIHQPMPLGYGLQFIPLWTIGGMVTFGIAFIFSVLFTNEYVALAAAYMTYFFYLAGVRHPRLKYNLHVADFMSGQFPGQLDRSTMLWGNTYPLTPIIGFFIAGVILVAVSTFVTTRQDF
jgi:ABC-2 type transport system permease protein